MVGMMGLKYRYRTKLQARIPKLQQEALFQKNEGYRFYVGWMGGLFRVEKVQQDDYNLECRQVRAKAIKNEIKNSFRTLWMNYFFLLTNFVCL